MPWKGSWLLHLPTGVLRGPGRQNRHSLNYKGLTKGLYKTPLHLTSPVGELAGQLSVVGKIYQLRVRAPPWLSLLSLYLHNVSPGPRQLERLFPEVCAHPKCLTAPFPAF